MAIYADGMVDEMWSQTADALGVPADIRSEVMAEARAAAYDNSPEEMHCAIECAMADHDG